VTSSSNLDLVRSIYAAWERGDFSSAEWAAPEIVYVRANELSPETATGVTGLAEVTRTSIDIYDDFRLVVDEYCELDAERVLVLEKLSGRGKASGLEVGELGARVAHLFHIRDGKVTRLVAYSDRERAFADLGHGLDADSTRE
jgi:ketosteroid isomerase-like protein